MKRSLLWIEFIFLFIALPLLFTFVFSPRGLFGVLWLMAFYAWWVLRTQHGLTLRGMWNGGAVTRANLAPIVRRFAISAVILTAGVMWLEPEKLFNFPQERPIIWVLVMLLYPLLSVIPQEIVFRSFYFARYTNVLAGEEGSRSLTFSIVINALLFGYAHIILQNWVAVGLCVIGGVFFAQTYARTRSLALVWIEHTLYGCFVFTIGLGTYFYHGTVSAVAG